MKELIQYDNLYARISDEENGRTLWDMYWQNPVTGEPEAFIAREGVTSGRRMRAIYCPEHLHLYHLLCKWEEEEDKEEEMKPRMSATANHTAPLAKKNMTGCRSERSIRAHNSRSSGFVVSLLLSEAMKKHPLS